MSHDDYINGFMDKLGHEYSKEPEQEKSKAEMRLIDNIAFMKRDENNSIDEDEYWIQAEWAFGQYTFTILLITLW